MQAMLAARRTFAVVILLELSLCTAVTSAQQPAAGEEIPLQRCDRLPVVTVRIDKVDMRFLVDTGSTSILNLKSFTTGRSKQIPVTSWSGTAATSAREVSLPELVLGRYHVRDLKLPAIDLSPIGEACGGRIDGILGVDLLERMGATIDLNRRVARLGLPPADADERARIEEMASAMDGCLGAFNLGRVQELAACFDSDTVLYTPEGEFRGRERVIEYIRQRYFSTTPRPHFEMKARGMRVLGDAVWHDYEYRIESPSVHIAGHGMMICRKNEGHWRVLNMHNSIFQPEASPRP